MAKRELPESQNSHTKPKENQMGGKNQKLADPLDPGIEINWPSPNSILLCNGLPVRAHTVVPSWIGEGVTEVLSKATLT